MRTVKSGFLEPLIFQARPNNWSQKTLPLDLCNLFFPRYFAFPISRTIFDFPWMLEKSSFHLCYHYYCNENLVFNYHDNRPLTSPVSIIISLHGDKWFVFYILQLGGPGTSLFGLLCPVGLNLPGWHSQCVWVSEEGTEAPYVNACTCKNHKK